MALPGHLWNSSVSAPRGLRNDAAARGRGQAARGRRRHHSLGGGGGGTQNGMLLGPKKVPTKNAFLKPPCTHATAVCLGASVPLLRPPPAVVGLHNQVLMWAQWAIKL